MCALLGVTTGPDKRPIDHYTNALEYMDDPNRLYILTYVVYTILKVAVDFHDPTEYGHDYYDSELNDEYKSTVVVAHGKGHRIP
ncbi:hypothetical protein HDV00_003115, partial [Rhizophlyctis rosea]